MLCNMFYITENEAHWQIRFSLLIAYRGVHLNERIFCIFCSGWIDCRGAFHSIHYAVQWAEHS